MIIVIHPHFVLREAWNRAHKEDQSPSLTFPLD